MSNIDKNTRIIDLTVGELNEILSNRESELKSEIVFQLKSEISETTGYVLMTEAEAEAYTGYKDKQLYNFRRSGVLNNYATQGEKKIKYLKRELDALLQFKGKKRA